MRRKLTAVVFAVLVFSLIAASAASLGGINAADVGADTTVVASCDTDSVDVAFGAPVYNPTTRAYDIDEVYVSGIADACIGKDISITLSNGAGTLTSSESGSVAVGSTDNNVADFNGAITPISAKALTRAAVVISG